MGRLAGFDLAGARRLVSRHRRVSAAEERDRHEQSYLVLQPSLDESWWRLHGGLAGAAGAVVDEALRRRADQLPRDRSVSHRAALALETICADSLDGAAESPSAGPSVTAFVGLGSQDGAESGAEMAAGPRIGPRALAELVCEGSVRLVGLEWGRPVVSTAATRTIPAAVRQLVLWRDGGCRAPGCSSRYRLQPHHVVAYADHGSHDPDNLVSLCWFHHHVVVHRRGMRIEKIESGQIRFVAPADSRAPPH